MSEVRDEPEDKQADERPVLDDAALGAWPADEPPAEFAERVLAARTASRRPRRRTPLYAVAAVSGVVTAAAVIIALHPRGTVERGTVIAATRTEAHIGERAVFVAEPGASLRWTVEASGTARVAQDSGEVFYRVEHGGPFVVATPAGDVSVLGTCFRVEVTEMRISKQGFAGAAIGAAVTAVVMVTAYEGKVLLANEKGKTPIAAGERGTATAGSPPELAANAKMGKRPVVVAIAEAPPPAEGASREDLLKRDAEQRKQIAKLAAQVAELTQGGADGGKHPGLPPHAFKTHPSHDELLEMARSCTVQFDNPPLEGEAQLPSKIAERAGLSPEETAAVQKVMDQTNSQVLAQLRALYIEVTGNKAAAEELSAQALINEVHSKGGRAEASAAQAEIANERAGLVPVPADITARPPSERMLRILSSQGDAVEKAVGQVIGPDRASALRGQGWGATMMMSGCRDGTEEDTR